MTRYLLLIVLVVALNAPAFSNPETANQGTAAVSFATAASPMTVVLDARQASRGLMFAHVTIPVRPGPLTLVYPKWIPGEHGPTGPLHVLASLHMSAEGHALQWRRDDVDLYAFHVDVPSGATALNVDFDVLMNAQGDTMATKNVAIVNWNRNVMYQANTRSDEVFAKPSIILPEGWSYGTALPNPSTAGGRVDFGEVTLETLIDSPLDMGRFSKRIARWSSGDATAETDIFADNPQDLEVPPKLAQAYANAVAEALALYGARHWQHYHALLTLSDAIGFQGIEHHQSSDDRAPDNFLTNPMQQVAGGDLLSHEFSHSWNGKYRRPYDLQQLNFQIPERTDLLWIYEGMNQYLGDLLSFRAGIRDPKKYPEYLAHIYAAMDQEPGRRDEPLIDTTTAAPWLYSSGGQYSSLRRTAGDFYTEGELIWLDADTIIRERTGGKRSLDDFLHAFAGPPDTMPKVVTYDRAQVEQLLNDTAPYDWHGFFTRYVYQVSEHPPSDDLARAGWKLVYNSTPNEFDKARNTERHITDHWYSLGLSLTSDGTVRDVKRGSAAWNAGMGPGMKIIAIDHQSYDADYLQSAIKDANHSKSPLSLLVEQDKWFGTYSLNYHGGLRFPHLERIKGTPDMLGAIMTPHRPK
ncbi:MAG: M61 family peptidase [Candidatus Baltobacteraceae bacterium]